MSLSESQKRQLKKLGHSLKPVVMIGSNGLTDAVFEEFDSTLNHHELIKIKVAVGDRDARDEIIVSLCQRASAELIQRIGNMALIFRRNLRNPKIHV